MGVIRSIAQIRSWFKTGQEPTQEQFEDTFDSFYHKEEDEIAMSAVTDLTQTLNNKYEKADGKALEIRMTEAEADIVDIYGRFDEVYERLDDAEDILDDHEEQLEKHDGEIAVLQQDVIDLDLHLAEHDRELVDHESRLKTAESDITSIKAKDEAQDKRLDGHDTSIKSNTEDIEKNASAITELQRAEQTMGTRINKGESRISTLETITTQHGKDIDGHQADIGKLYQIDAGHESDITDLRVQLQSLQIEGKIIPGRMIVDAPAKITLRNRIPQRISAQLRPDYVTQNVLFLCDDRAVSVDPANGEITVNGKGESVVHVIPTENVALAQKKTIQVVNPSALINNDGTLLLDVDWKILTT